jgi:hypothetical protein
MTTTGMTMTMDGLTMTTDIMITMMITEIMTIEIILAMMMIIIGIRPPSNLPGCLGIN